MGRARGVPRRGPCSSAGASPATASSDQRRGALGGSVHPSYNDVTISYRCSHIKSLPRRDALRSGRDRTGAARLVAGQRPLAAVAGRARLSSRARGGLAGDTGACREGGFRRAAAGATGSRRPVGGRRVLPRGLRLPGPGGRGQRRAAVDGHDVVPERVAGVGPRRLGAVRHRRAARRQQSLGVRRPAVLGRRGRLLHQRLHAGERRMAGCRRLRDRRLVRRAPAGRRRVELRVDRGLRPAPRSTRR